MRSGRREESSEHAREGAALGEKGEVLLGLGLLGRTGPDVGPGQTVVAAAGVGGVVGEEGDVDVWPEAVLAVRRGEIVAQTCQDGETTEARSCPEGGTRWS